MLKCEVIFARTLSINFRRKYIIIYLKGDFDGVQDLIQGHFEEQLNIGTRRDGFSFQVETQSQFESLVSWLKLDS
jgi:hypothetical protein